MSPFGNHHRAKPVRRQGGTTAEGSRSVNAWILIAATAVGCPWGHHRRMQCDAVTVVTLPCTPVCSPCWIPTCPAPIVQSSPCGCVMDEVKAVAVIEEVAEATKEEQTLVAVAAKEEEDEIVTENVGLSFPGSSSLDSLALDWGVAAIGPGTLHPHSSLFMPSFGGFFSPNSSQGSPGTTGYTPILTPTDCCTACVDCGDVTVIVNNPPAPAPVPEPASLAIWATCIVGAATQAIRKRRQK
jgi:hypothetical protein